MWKPEVIVVAKAMYESSHFMPELLDEPVWQKLDNSYRDDICRCVVAGLAAVQVSDELARAVIASDFDGQYPDSLAGAFQNDFTAAIRHLTTPDASDAKGEG